MGRNRDKGVYRNHVSRREVIRCYKKSVEAVETSLCDGELVENLYDIYKYGHIPFEIYFHMLIGIMRDMREWPFDENNY